MHGSSAVIQTPAQRKLIGRTIPVPPPVSSPSSILLLRLSALSFPPGKSRRTFQKRYFLIFLFFLIVVGPFSSYGGFYVYLLRTQFCNACLYDS